jgi:hypothetical protein
MAAPLPLRSDFTAGAFRGIARGFRRSVGCSVLHQCIRRLIGACAPGHHGYQRACGLISGQPAVHLRRRAQGPSSSAVALTLWLGVSRPGLTEPSTVPRSCRSGLHRVCLGHSKLHSLLRTAQAIRASLLASAIVCRKPRSCVLILCLNSSSCSRSMAFVVGAAPCLGGKCVKVI